MKADYFYLLVGIICLLITYQDVKQRSIHILLPIALLLIGLLLNHLSIKLNSTRALYNIMFVIINIVGLTIYFSFKAKRIINPIDSLIGLGDIFFFFAIAPFFDVKPYILFFITGLVFSLIAHLVASRFKKQTTIPLAGYLALFFVGNIIMKYIFNFSFIS